MHLCGISPTVHRQNTQKPAAALEVIVFDLTLSSANGALLDARHPYWVENYFFENSLTMNCEIQWHVFVNLKVIPNLILYNADFGLAPPRLGLFYLAGIFQTFANITALNLVKVCENVHMKYNQYCKLNKWILKTP